MTFGQNELDSIPLSESLSIRAKAQSNIRDILTLP